MHAQAIGRATSNDPVMAHGVGALLMGVVDEVAVAVADPTSDLEQFRKTLEMLQDVLEDVRWGEAGVGWLLWS
jgi:hypothetical protein